MDETWKVRLLKAVDDDPRSDRAISLATKLGVNTVNELRNTDKSPSIEKVLRLSEELNLSLGYLFLGLDSDEEKAPIRGEPQIRAVLQRIEGLGEENVGMILGIILNTLKVRAYEQERIRTDDQSGSSTPRHELDPSDSR
jgi:transcriptional regulator with XRE-family HTH domain